jgi:S1-C subfamily serine protease
MKQLKQTILIFILLTTSLVANPSNSVVKIFTAASSPSYKYPWQTSRISNFTGSGVVIENNQILTSAHVISDGKFIEIKKENNPKKYIASIKYISHQADLAILEVKDKSFFKNIKPLELDEDIKTDDKVTVLGYPVGGNIMSTTSGIVSRIEYKNYVWSGSSLLAIQIDAAINSGNSGGAIINSDNKLVGIAMMSRTKANNIGFIVPAIIIKSFLEDIKDGVVNGYHEDSIIVQKIANDSLKKFYGLDNRTGVLITHVGMDEKTLKINDIILGIDDNNIANNGTIESKYGRVSFNLIFHKKQIGQKVKLDILRDKKEISVKYTLKKITPLINREFNVEPRYIIYGGFAFSPLTKNYLKSLSSSSSINFKMLFYEKRKTLDYQEPIICLNTIFPNNVNRGYTKSSNILSKINGIKIRNFKHLVELLDKNSDEFTVFEFIEKETIVLNTKEAKKSIDNIKKIYNLKNDRRE